MGGRLLRGAHREHVLAGIRDTLTHLGGIARRRDLRCTATALRAAIQDGVIIRLARDRYALTSVDPAIREAHRLTAVRSHLTAAIGHGWQVAHPPRAITLTVAPGRRITERHLDIHYRPLGRRERRRGITDPLQTVLDCARSLDFPQALAVADSALRSGMVQHEELLRAAARARGPNTANIRRVAQHANPLAANPFESVLRAITIDVGLHATPQVDIRDNAFRARVDLADTTLGLVLEADSFEFHSTRQAHVKDAIRYTSLAAADWTIMRFSWEDVFRSPSYVADQLRRWAARERARTHNGRRPGTWPTTLATNHRAA